MSGIEKTYALMNSIVGSDNKRDTNKRSSSKSTTNNNNNFTTEFKGASKRANNYNSNTSSHNKIV